MALFIIIIVIVGLVFIGKSIMNNGSQQSKRQSHDITVSPEFQNLTKKRTTMQRREDGAFVLNGGTSSQITLIGANVQTAHAIKDKCDIPPSSSFYDTVHDIRDILLENSIEVAEVNAFRNEVRPIIEKRVQKLISEDPEWESLGEMDKKDKKEEYIKNSMVSFPDTVTPAVESALTNLAFSSPFELPLLREFIQEYGLRNINTYNAYKGRKNPIISIPNSDYRKPLEELVKVGLACTGNEMSVEELLSSLTLNKLNEIANSETKFTRKDKAIKYISEMDNVSSIVEKNIVLRSLFVLKPLPALFQEFDFDKFNELLSYYESLADIVVSVFNGLSPISYKKR